MAQIVLISRDLNHSLWPLAASLRSQQHQICVITNRNANIPPLEDHLNGVSVLTYFKEWTAWEAFKLLPSLFSFNPQIVHILTDQGDLSTAEVILATITGALPHCSLAVSIFNWDVTARKKPWLKFLLEHSDVVTGPSVESLAQLRGLNIKNKKQNRGLLPPLIPASSEKNYFDSPTGDNSVLLFEPWLNKKQTLAIPWTFDLDNIKKNLDWLQILSEKYQILFLGSLDTWPRRHKKLLNEFFQQRNISYGFSENHNLAELEHLIKKCAGLWLAAVPMTSTEYTEYVWMGINANVSLIIDQKQAQIHSGLWQDGQNIHILSSESTRNSYLNKKAQANHLEPWRKSVQNIVHKKSLELPQKISARMSRELIDHSTNDLNRLYNKALSEK